MKKVKEMLSSIITIVLLLCIGAGIGFHYGLHFSDPEKLPVEDLSPDLKLPGESESRVITCEEIEVALFEIQELSTHAGRYTVCRNEDEVREVLGWDIFGIATNSISIRCQGIVKVGFDVSEIIVTIDAESKTVYIKLPEAKVLDNYVIWDTVECVETNNMFNPIEFSQYQTIIAEMEAEGLETMVEAGIFNSAREHFEAIVVTYLSGITTYNIVVV